MKIRKSIRLLKATSDPNLNCQKASKTNVPGWFPVEPWLHGPQQREGGQRLLASRIRHVERTTDALNLVLGSDGEGHHFHHRRQLRPIVVPILNQTQREVVLWEMAVLCGFSG